VPGQIAARTAREKANGRRPYDESHFASILRMLDREEPEYAE